MMNIRRGAFETNSSSTHTICITKKEFNPDECLSCWEGVEFYYDVELGFFGWGVEIKMSMSDKLSYLYTAITQRYLEDNKQKYDECLKHISSVLKRYNVKVDFIKPKKKYYEEGWIDHGDELEDFITAIMQDDNLLLNFLCNEECPLVLSNDNTDNEVVNDFLKGYKNKSDWYIYEKGN